MDTSIKGEKNCVSLKKQPDRFWRLLTVEDKDTPVYITPIVERADAAAGSSIKPPSSSSFALNLIFFSIRFLAETTMRDPHTSAPKVEAQGLD